MKTTQKPPSPQTITNRCNRGDVVDAVKSVRDILPVAVNGHQRQGVAPRQEVIPIRKKSDVVKKKKKFYSFITKGGHDAKLLNYVLEYRQYICSLDGDRQIR